jgi:serine/threonine protein kinase
MNDPEEQRVGPWALHSRLGHGGNATVWEATRAHHDEPVALKIINVKKVEREPYQRFVREIQFLQQHQSVSGLLPLIDAHLPESPTKNDQPWLAMPIARPIATALADRPLGDVVAAMAAIADTLARLQREFGIAHRDVKPGNLYELNGAWLIGDFGLIAVPDAEGLTLEGKPVGPAHYTAYEMILNPATADPHPADVYSLGKTLWVLATDQAFPPEGHQPVGMRRFEIGDFRPHARSGVLDHEVDLMTRIHPEERPSKEQVARDLLAWNELASDPVAFDVSDVRSRLRAKLESAMSEQDIEEQRKEMALAAVRRLQVLTGPLNDGLKGLYPRAQIDSQSDDLTRNTVKSFSGHGHRMDFRWHRCTLLAPFERTGDMTLRMSRSLELRSDGMLMLNMMVHVGPEGVMGNAFYWQMHERSAPAGTVEAEKMLEDAVHELSDALRKGIDVFVDQLPDPESDG